MNKTEKRQLIAYFLKKTNSTLATKLLGEMENFGDVEWDYLYGIIFGETEKEKLDALQGYMREIENIKQQYTHTEQKMKHLAAQMEELIQNIQEESDAEDLLQNMNR